MLDSFLNVIKESPKSKKNILEKELARLLAGYNKSKYDAQHLLTFVEKAIHQAKALDTAPQDRWIESALGTRVYILIERILY